MSNAGPSSMEKSTSRRWSMARERAAPPLTRRPSAIGDLVKQSVERRRNIKLEGEANMVYVKELMDSFKSKENVVQTEAKMDKKIVLTFDPNRSRNYIPPSPLSPETPESPIGPPNRKLKRVIHVKTRGTITEPPTIIINTGTDADLPIAPSIKIGTPAIVQTDRNVSAIPETTSVQTETKAIKAVDMATITMAREYTDVATETEVKAPAVQVRSRKVGPGEVVRRDVGVGGSTTYRDRQVGTVKTEVRDTNTNTDAPPARGTSETGVNAVARVTDQAVHARASTKTTACTADIRPDTRTMILSTEGLYGIREVGVGTDVCPTRATATMTHIKTFREKAEMAERPDSRADERVENLKKEIRVLYEYRERIKEAMEYQAQLQTDKEESEGSSCSFTDIYCKCCVAECGSATSCHRCGSPEQEEVEVEVKSDNRFNHQRCHTLLDVKETEREVAAPIRIRIPPRGRAVRVRTPSTHGDGEYRFIELF